MYCIPNLNNRSTRTMSNVDGRNFRSHYYEKVGFRGVEEKKSLQILLKDDPVDLEKLEIFCVRFPVPVIYRPLVWKLVLGVLPPHYSSHEYVWKQRQEEYHDLHHALEVMSIINKDTPTNMIFMKMYLLVEGALPLEDQNVPETDEQSAFIEMASAVMNMYDEEEVDCYWMTAQFYRQCMKYNHAKEMPGIFQTILKKEDPTLFNHLDKIRVLSRLPYNAWFTGVFASVFPAEAVARIWDRLIGGACKLLLYVALSLLAAHRKSILSLDRLEPIKQLLAKIQPDRADSIITEAIDMWEKSGSHLRPDVT